jgi:hypothetical protein
MSPLAADLVRLIRALHGSAPWRGTGETCRGEKLASSGATIDPERSRAEPVTCTMGAVKAGKAAPSRDARLLPDPIAEVSAAAATLGGSAQSVWTGWSRPSAVAQQDRSAARPLLMRAGPIDPVFRPLQPPGGGLRVLGACEFSSGSHQLRGRPDPRLTFEQYRQDPSPANFPGRSRIFTAPLFCRLKALLPLWYLNLVTPRLQGHPPPDRPRRPPPARLQLCKTPHYRA